MTKSVAQAVITSVSAPYGGKVDASALSYLITEESSAESLNPYAFSFFSEVPLNVQREFIEEMKLQLPLAKHVAKVFQENTGAQMLLAKA